MSIPYVESGRTKQKGRTRAAMLIATRALLAEGVTPTVEQAADRAEVSRTTAYRYFPNQRALLEACYPNLDAPTLLAPDAPADPIARLEQVTANVARQLIEHEPELRANLRLSLEPSRSPQEGLPLRQGRVIRWLEDALSPLRGRMSKREIHTLVLAIRATLGIEALIWLTDVGGVSRAEACDIMCSSARTLLEAALAKSEKKARKRG